MELKFLWSLGLQVLTLFKLYLYGIEIALIIRLFMLICVQIVPLWNWNYNDEFVPFRDSMVQIVPLWNWNYIRYIISCQSLSSNCTFMELKYFMLAWLICVMQVQIVPLWNWNRAVHLFKRKGARSNCTFMELK